MGNAIPTGIIDSHAHLDMLEDVDGVMRRAKEAGVEAVVTIGTDASSSEWGAALAASRRDVWATVGLHPHDAKDATEPLLDRLEELAGMPRVVGVGETGLDFHYDRSPREEQRRVFRDQIAIAKRVGKALVVHTREAWDDTFDILEDEGPPSRLIFHCWSGGPAEAERALALGAVLSFSGTITFPKNQPLVSVATATPLDRLMIETDSPFLSPVPHRGKRNEPCRVVLVARALATIRGLPEDEVAVSATATARRLYSL